MRENSNVIYNLAMIEILKEDGEYVVKVPYDIWVNKIFSSLIDNEEFKTIVLEDYISSNKHFLEIKGVNFTKKDNLLFVDGKDLKYISNDNVLRGKIHIVSQNFSSFLQKNTVPPISSLPVELLVEIEDKEVKIRYRNFLLTTKIIAFFILRRLGIIPSNFHVESVHHILVGTLPQNAKYVKVDIIKYSRYILPHKVTFSIVISQEDNTHYYILTLSKNRWKIQSANTRKGCINFFHQFLLETLKNIEETYRTLASNSPFFQKLTNAFETILKTINTNLFLKTFSEILLLVGILILSIKVQMILVLVVTILVFVALRRMFLYFNFNRRIV